MHPDANKGPSVSESLKWLISWPADEAQEPEEHIQDRIISLILFGILILGSLALIPSAVMVAYESKWGIFGLNILLYCWAVRLFFLRKKMTRPALALHLCSFTYILGVGVLFLAGPMRAGLIYLFAFQIMAGALMGRRGAWLAFAANLLAMAAVAAALSLGFTTLAVPTDHGVLRWLVLCLNFLFVATIATLLIVSRNRVLQQILNNKLITVKRLERETEERIAANKALKTSEDSFRNLVENINEVVFALNQEGRFVYVSPRLKAVTGYSRRDVLNRPFLDFTHGRDRERLAAAFTRVLSGEKTALEFQLIKDNGDAAWISASVTPFDESGKAKGLSGIFTDITEQKLLREEKEALQEKLAQAQKMEAVGRLAGGIAHDFNNILSPILGYSELVLQDSAEDATTRENIQAVITAALRAKDLVKQVLLYGSRAEDDPRPMDLGRAVDDARRLVRASLPPSIEIEFQDAPESIIVMADPVQIHRVVVNLCSNAHFAMRDAGGVLGLKLERVTMKAGDPHRPPNLPPGPYTRLSVTDQGCGMTPGILEKIFEPYFTTKEVGEGSGIGLAAVHSIVTRLGGDVTAASEPGKGSCFAVHLPLADAGDAPPREEDASPPPTGCGRILLVDDEIPVMQMTQKMLTRLGYHVTAFYNSQAALEAFWDAPDDWDLVMTDVTMPGLDGGRLAELIRKARPETPIVLCTGRTEAVADEEVQRMGGSILLNKPVNMLDMAHAVFNLMPKSGAPCEEKDG